MANSTRARLRAPEDMGASTRAPENPCAPQDMPAPEPTPEESPPKRSWPAPVVYTEEALAEARRRYEQTDESLTSIAAGLGTSARSLQRIAQPAAWVRYVSPPRDATPAARLLMEARALEAKAAPRAQDGSSQTAPPQDASPGVTAADLDRIARAVMRELAVVEAMRAAMKNIPQRPRDGFATAQTISTLTETLNKVQRMRCGLADQHHDDTDDLPSDIDARREALARRIEAFFASRPDEGTPAGVDPKRADGA